MMMASIVARVVVLVVMSLCLQVPSSVHADTVTIYNDMGPGVTLGVQCQRGYYDMGYKTLLPRQSYEFGFTPGLLGRDVYECSFHSNGFPIKHMRVYEGIKFHDNFCLCRNCHWSVTKSGFDCEHGQYTEKWK